MKEYIAFDSQKLSPPESPSAARREARGHERPAMIGTTAARRGGGRGRAAHEPRAAVRGARDGG